MDDIAARLRQTHWNGCNCVGCEAADEIERLRKELGQVSDADSWVSESDAAHLDSMLNWCEFNAMDWHRALARLVNDRARLRGEVNRLRAGGCARDQRTTQFCAEALTLQREVERLRVIVQGWEHSARNAERDIAQLREERDEARREVCELLYNRQGGWPKEHANERGWDCFKENTDDQ